VLYVNWRWFPLKKISGFVCVGVREKQDPYPELLVCYGPPSDPSSERGFDGLYFNGFQTFSTLLSAQKALPNIREEFDQFSAIRIGHVWIQVAETVDESLHNRTIRNSKSLIVFWYRDTTTLMGRFVEGRPCSFKPIPGADLFENGLEPITNHESAIYIASEASRQSGGSQVALATFKFRWVD